MGKLEKFLDKGMSARFLATTALVFTFCIMWHKVGESMNQVAVPVVLLALNWYFQRQDRPASEGTSSSKVEVTKVETPKDVAGGT